MQYFKLTKHLSPHILVFESTNLKQLLWNLLQEAIVMRPPQAQPREQKICEAASPHTYKKTQILTKFIFFFYTIGLKIHIVRPVHTFASRTFCHCGVRQYLIPFMAPSKVMPRMNRMVKTTYGNVAVKYTTWIRTDIITNAF